VIFAADGDISNTAHKDIYAIVGGLGSTLTL